MARRPYDPLDFVPSPEIVHQKLAETLTLAERLRLPVTTADRLPTPSVTQATEGRANG